MTIGQLQERKRFVFVDRVRARREFEDLLLQEDDKRVLAVREDGGQGKSHLLRHLDRRCRTEPPRTPVCLVPVDELQPKEPLTLLETIARDLSQGFGFAFDEFWRYHGARARADWEPFASASSSPQPIYVSINLQGNVFTDVDQINVTALEALTAPVSGLSRRTSGPESSLLGGGSIGDGGQARWSEQQEQHAVAMCIQTFFDELLEQSTEQKVVLLLDGMEACGDALRDWLARVVLPTHFLRRRPDLPQLYLVLAGREIPVLEELEGQWPPEDIDSLVRTAPEFEPFDEDAVRELLDAYDVPYGQEHLRTYLSLIQEMGVTPLGFANLIQQVRPRLAG